MDEKTSQSMMTIQLGFTQNMLVIGPFVRSLVLLIWTCGGGCPGFKAWEDPLIFHTYMFDEHLVQHLLTSWQRAWKQNLFYPFTFSSIGGSRPNAALSNLRSKHQNVCVICMYVISVLFQ